MIFSLVSFPKQLLFLREAGGVCAAEGSGKREEIAVIGRKVGEAEGGGEVR